MCLIRSISNILGEGVFPTPQYINASFRRLFIVYAPLIHTCPAFYGTFMQGVYVYAVFFRCEKFCCFDWSVYAWCHPSNQLSLYYYRPDGGSALPYDRRQYPVPTFFLFFFSPTHIQGGEGLVLVSLPIILIIGIHEISSKWLFFNVFKQFHGLLGLLCVCNNKIVGHILGRFRLILPVKPSFEPEDAPCRIPFVRVTVSF